MGLGDQDGALGDLGERAQQMREARSRLDEAQLQLERERTNVAELAGQLARDADCVARLEGPGLTALVRIALGGRRERLDLARRELLAARQRYDEGRAAVEALERLALAARAEMDALQGAGEAYGRALAGKEQQVIREGGPAAGRIQEIARRAAGLRAGTERVQAAVQAGWDALDALSGLRAILEDARAEDEEWAALQTSGLAPTGRPPLVPAHERALEAQHRLRLLQRELGAVTGSFAGGYTLDMGAFDAVADSFLDDLIGGGTDEGAAGRTLKSVEALEEKVRAALADLDRLMEELHGRSEELEAERRRLLEGA